MLSLDVVAMNVVEATVPRFPNDGQRGPSCFGVRIMKAPGSSPVNGCFVDSAHTVCIGEENRLFQKSGLVDPGSSSHLSIAVETRVGSEDGPIVMARWQDCGHPSSNGAFADS